MAPRGCFVGCSGTIPSEMGSLSNLIRLILRHNAFTGTLPPELGDARMKDLILYHNQLEVSSVTELSMRMRVRVPVR